MRILPAVALTLLLAGALAAQDAGAPKLRVRYGKPTGVWVGERQPLIVEILAPRWFAGATRFDLPEVPGLIFFEPTGRPVVGSEEIGGMTYTVRTHELAIFAFRAGTQVVPPFAVRFAVAGESGPRSRLDYRLETPEGRFDVQSPPGAEGLSMLISTPRLEVTETWSPAPGALAVGDAVVRRIRFEAADVPGMAFPRIPFRGAEGLAVYAKPGVVRDRTERGEFKGVREDTATYVCERPGTIHLPALAIPWWNTKAEKLERVTLPAVTFEVAPGRTAPTTDARAGPPARPETSEFPWWLVVAAIALAGLGVALLSRHSRLASWLDRRCAGRGGDEPNRFAALLDACRSGRPRDALNRLYRWLDLVLPARTATTADALTDAVTDPELRRELGALEHAVLADAPWTGTTLAAALGRARALLCAGREGVRPATDRLPALNPTAEWPRASRSAPRPRAAPPSRRV